MAPVSVGGPRQTGSNPISRKGGKRVNLAYLPSITVASSKRPTVN